MSFIARFATVVVVSKGLVPRNELPTYTPGNICSGITTNSRGQECTLKSKGWMVTGSMPHRTRYVRSFILGTLACCTPGLLQIPPSRLTNFPAMSADLLLNTGLTPANLPA